MANIVIFVVLLGILRLPCSAQLKSPSNTPVREQVVFREPFLLKLRVDNERYYQERFDRIPYVANNEVYLFAGETFGVNIEIAGSRIFGITYQPDLARADIEFKLIQEASPGDRRMILTIRNKLKRELFLDAVMTVPGKKGVYPTNLIPVGAGHDNIESWPHPIVQLMLKNLRFSDNTLTTLP
jgi:hypothetical protein